MIECHFIIHTIYVIRPVILLSRDTLLIRSFP